jgi:hypothetical protein
MKQAKCVSSLGREFQSKPPKKAEEKHATTQIDVSGDKIKALFPAPGGENVSTMIYSHPCIVKVPITILFFISAVFD